MAIGNMSDAQLEHIAEQLHGFQLNHQALKDIVLPKLP